MTTKTRGVIIIVTVVFLAVGIWATRQFYTNNPNLPTVPENQILNQNNSQQTPTEDTPSPSINNSNTSSSTSSNQSSPDNNNLNNAPGSYQDYSSEKISSNIDTVLFFHAKWCPSCKTLNDDIEKNRSNIPTNLNILKVDYDSSTELRRKYGVTSQHTLVKVNSDGSEIKKEVGLYRLSSLEDVIKFNQ